MLRFPSPQNALPDTPATQGMLRFEAWLRHVRSSKNEAKKQKTKLLAMPEARASLTATQGMLRFEAWLRHA